MPEILSACPGCSFENPRAWRTCARCGRTLMVDPAHGANVHLAATRSSSTATAPTDTDPSGTPLGSDGEEQDTVVESPLIGQTEASEALRTGLERAFTLGAPTLVALEGPRGSGKTRLLVYASEFAARIALDVRVLYGSCRAGGNDGSYAPFSRMLLERFGVTPASAPNAVRAKMTMAVGERMHADASTVAETTHLLGHLAGIPFPDSPFLARFRERPDELHRRACEALRRFIEAEGQEHPVLVLLDDLHHADDDAWDVLAELVNTEAHVACVVAGDSPVAERAGELSPAGGFAAGPIEPLGEQDVASMLYVLLPGLQRAPEPLVAAVTHRSGGNPSAVRELVLALEESGVFVEDENGLSVDLPRLESGQLPVTTMDAVRARLARLGAFDRATLERAAVVGERFWDGAVLAQMRSEREPPGRDADPLSIWSDDSDAEALHEVLASLTEKEFLTEAATSDLPGATEYTFTIAATRELLYDGIDEELRVSRHANVARWLGAIAEHRREGMAAMIAPHLERAGQTVRAGRAYVEAALYERLHLHTTAAARYIERALPLIPSEDVVRKIDALHEHGSLLTTLGRYDEALQSFSEMLRQAWSIGARGKGGAALNRIARVHRQRGEDARARKLLERALELFRAAGDLRGVASTLDDLAQVHRLQGQSEEALRAASEALEIRRAHADQRGEALSLHTIGTVELMRGNLSAAGSMFEQALEQRQHIADYEGMLQTQNALGILAYERGERSAAIDAWTAALEQAREMADRRSECFLQNNIGEALMAEGRLDEAHEPLERAQQLATSLGDRRAMAEVERNLGLLALRRDDDHADEMLLRAKDLAEQYGGTESIALAHRALGMLHARTMFDAEGEPDRRAEESFLTSIDLLRQIGNEKEAARSLAELGQHLIERGDAETARERLREARAIMRRIGLAELERVERTLKELG